MKNIFKTLVIWFFLILFYEVTSKGLILMKFKQVVIYKMKQFLNEIIIKINAEIEISGIDSDISSEKALHMINSSFGFRLTP